MKTFLYQESEFSVENQVTWRSELPMMNIIQITLKNKITTLKNLIEVREITLNDPKFGINKSLDTLLYDWLNSMEKLYYVSYRNISNVQSFVKFFKTLCTCFHIT